LQSIKRVNDLQKYVNQNLHLKQLPKTNIVFCYCQRFLLLIVVIL